MVTVLISPILFAMADEKMFDKVEQNNVAGMIVPRSPCRGWNFRSMKEEINELHQIVNSLYMTAPRQEDAGKKRASDNGTKLVENAFTAKSVSS